MRQNGVQFGSPWACMCLHAFEATCSACMCPGSAPATGSNHRPRSERMHINFAPPIETSFNRGHQRSFLVGTSVKPRPATLSHSFTKLEMSVNSPQRSVCTCVHGPTSQKNTRQFQVNGWHRVEPWERISPRACGRVQRKIISEMMNVSAGKRGPNRLWEPAHSSANSSGTRHNIMDTTPARRSLAHPNRDFRRKSCIGLALQRAKRCHSRIAEPRPAIPVILCCEILPLPSLRIGALV